MSRDDGPTLFELLPAIDLRGGRVVRLRGGDFARETVYGEDPLATALRLVAAGATWLHVVDLDGAREGGVRQAAAIRRILDGVGVRARCQVAGGLRDEAAVAAALDGGAARVVVGTAALRDFAFGERLVHRFGAASIVAALDVRAGTAVGDGRGAGAPAVAGTAALRGGSRSTPAPEKPATGLTTASPWSARNDRIACSSAVTIVGGTRSPNHSGSRCSLHTRRPRGSLTSAVRARSTSMPR